MLFFSATMMANPASVDKAYALEVPVIPSTMTLTAAPDLPLVSPLMNRNDSETEVKKSVKKKIKPASEKEVEAPLQKAGNKELTANQKSVKAKVEAVKAPENTVLQVPEISAPIASAEIDSIGTAVKDNINKVDEKKPLEKIETPKVVVAPVQELKAKVEGSSINNIEVKTEVRPEIKSEIKVEKKLETEQKPEQVSKIDTNVSVSKVSKVTEKKNIAISNQKTSEKAGLKPAPRSEGCARKAIVKKAVEENESVITEGWDWFSTPLVWVKDANGKMILVADSKASKIELDRYQKSPEKSKAVDIAYELPLITSVKPAEPDFIQIEPRVAEDVEITEKERKEDSESVEMELVSIPAVPAVEESETINNTDVEVSVEEPQKIACKAVEKSSNTEKSEYKPFAKALEKVEAIRKLRKAEAESKGEVLAKAGRSAQAIKIANYISELIGRIKDTKCHTYKGSTKQLIPSVDSDEEGSDEIIEASASSKVEESENIGNASISPNVGVFGSSSSRAFCEHNSWKYAWTK